MSDFDFETLYFMNYDVCMSPSFESSATKDLASMSCLICQASFGIFQVLFVCLIYYSW